MKSVMQITLCVGLLIIIAYVTLSWAQQKPPQPKSVSVSENSWVPGLLPHGEVKDGLAAFLLCHRDCFKVGQAIPLSYGIVNIGSGLRRETNLQEADENAEFKIRIWWLQNEPELRWNYSWFEVTGPDGQDVPYHGGTGTLPSSVPLDEFSVLLHLHPAERLWKKGLHQLIAHIAGCRECRSDTKVSGFVCPYE